MMVLYGFAPEPRWLAAAKDAGLLFVETTAFLMGCVGIAALAVLAAALMGSL